MASPTPDDALAYAQRFIGGLPLDDAAIKLRLLDDAHKQLWNADNWNWTIGTLETVSLVNNTQDVSLLTPPSDFLNLLHCTMIMSNGEKTDLKVSANLPSTLIVKGSPTQVQAITNGAQPQQLRFFPVPSGYSDPPKVLSVYKKVSGQVNGSTETNSYNATPFFVPDEWFHVYQEIVLLKAFEFAGDPRLGSIQVGPQGPVYTGQYAVVEDKLRKMTAREENIYTTFGEEVHF